jgi:hypothetical protein
MSWNSPRVRARPFFGADLALDELLAELRAEGGPGTNCGRKVIAMRRHSEQLSVGEHHLTQTSAASGWSAPLFGATVRQGTALALAAAAGLHLAAFSGHLGEGPVVATFFLVVAGLQLGAAAAIHGAVGAAGRLSILFGNIGLIVVWAASRTVGVAGTHAGDPEQVGTLDSLAVAVEALAVIGLFVLARHISPASRPRRHGRPALFLTAFVVGAAAVFVAPPTHGHYEHRPSSTLDVARGGIVTPAIDAPDAHPIDESTTPGETGSEPACTQRTGCHHPHGHGHHTH